MSQNRSRDSHRNLIIAMAICAPMVALIVAIGWAFEWWKIGGYLEKFQTLLTGLIAIGAACIGAYFVQKQINLAQDHEQERLERMFDAARALLPHTLVGVYRYCETCTAFLLEARRSETGAPAPPPPILDPATVTQLRDFVAASPERIRRKFAVLLIDLQVQSSRVESFVAGRTWSESLNVSNAEDYMTVAATTYAVCDRMLPFARREADDVDLAVTEGDVRRALKVLEVDEFLLPRPHEIAGIYARGFERRAARQL